MGLFDKLRKNKNEKHFFIWLDKILKNDLPDDIKAINFNLYEDVNHKWSIELVGTSLFDEDDNDWACYEVYTTRDNVFVLEKEGKWKEMERLFAEWVNNYLDTGKYCDKLKQYQAVGIGFVDGDINILYKQ